MADRFELAHQRVGGIDLVVPIGADQQQVLQIGARQQILEQIECRRVQPLQVVEEQRKRMFGPRKHADKSPEHQLKASLRFLWRKLRHWRLLANDVLQFRDELDNQQSVWIQRLAQRVAPFA